MTALAVLAAASLAWAAVAAYAVRLAAAAHRLRYEVRAQAEVADLAERVGNLERKWKVNAVSSALAGRRA